jgi:hypothetical protein
MKKYFKDLDTDKKLEIILNNNDLNELVSQDYYEYNMQMQEEEGELMFGKDSHKYIEIRGNYDSFYLRLLNWQKFIENLDKDYLCSKGIDLYNNIIELKKEYESIDISEEEERFDILEEELEAKCRELLEICENQLHEYEQYNEEDLKEFVRFNLEENDLFSDFYIIDNDYSKVYSDYTKTYK